MRKDSGWVVDASVAVKWHLSDEDHVAEASWLYQAFSAGRAMLLAPHYIRYEVANALETARVQGRVEPRSALQELRSFLRMGIDLEHDSDDHLAVAVEIARRFRITPYDALYVALAEQTGLSFVTADLRLYQQIRGHAPYACWIGDVSTLL